MDATRIILAMDAAREWAKADLEASGTAGDIARRDMRRRQIDALAEIMGAGDLVTLIAKELRQ